MTLDEMSSEDMLNGQEVVDRLDEIDAELEDDLAVDQEAELRDEQTGLRSVLAAVEGYGGDRVKDTVFIRDSFFKEYAMQLADDIGAIDSNAGWPNSYIDWDRAAGDLQMDYTSVEIDGVDYWFR